MIRRSGSRRLLAIALATCRFFSGILAAEETGRTGLPQGASVVPPVFYPSDVVELRLPLAGAWEGGAIKAPESGETLEFLSAEIAKTGSGAQELRLRFIAWKPGALEIPSFGTQEAKFGPYTLRAESYIGMSGAGMSPPRPPMLLRGTRVMVAAAFAVLGLAAFMVIGFTSFVLPWLERFGRRIREKRPYARFAHDIRVALKRRNDDDPRRFYDYLSAAFRRYAGSRLGYGIDSLTPGEMHPCGPLGPDAEELSRILARSDLIRFADAASERDIRAADAAALQRIVGGMEARIDGV